jgi:4-hydroxybenzoate polyprenyltransferase
LIDIAVQAGKLFIFVNMVNIPAIFKILRPGNAAMTAAGSCLGFWLAGAQGPFYSIICLALSSAMAVGFGNVINDIIDAKPDAINHPERPIPAGQLSMTSAKILLAVLFVASIISAFAVSAIHAAGCAIPLLLLVIYSYKLKSTPLAGNIIVSVLVAWSLYYGGLGAPGLTQIIVPCILAFLLNLSREIIKDIQDKAGDSQHGIATTASLPAPFLKILIVVIGLVWAMLCLMPFFLGHFKLVYLIICILLLLPVHAAWMTMFIMSRLDNKTMGVLSLIVKLEMLGGLAALAADRLI